VKYRWRTIQYNHNQAPTVSKKTVPHLEDLHEPLPDSTAISTSSHAPQFALALKHIVQAAGHGMNQLYTNVLGLVSFRIHILLFCFCLNLDCGQIQVGASVTVRVTTLVFI